MDERRTKKIELDPWSFTESEEQVVNGVKIRVGMSPYDVPESIEGSYDQEANRFVIRFGYVGGNEPTVERGVEPVVLMVGKRSGRLYEIRVHVTMLGVDAVLLEINEAIDQLAQRVPDRIQNLEASKRVLNMRGNELTEVLTHH